MDGSAPRSSQSGWPVVLSVAVMAAIGCRSMAGADAPASAEAERWVAGLPACPCVQPQVAAVGDGWAADRHSSLRQHPGAEACFRSYPPVETAVGRSGQQCCYDRSGELVTSGSAAGTPDRATSCRGESADGRMKVRVLGFAAHVLKDVRPWAPQLKSWRYYHSHWPPNNSNACPLHHLEVDDAGAVFSWRWVAETNDWQQQPLQLTCSPGPSAIPAGAAWQPRPPDGECRPL